MRAGSAELHFSGGGHVDVVEREGRCIICRSHYCHNKVFFQALKMRYSFIYLAIMGTAVENHFCDGVMAGLKRAVSGNALHASQYCLNYRRGFIVGYAHRLSERTGDSLRAAWERKYWRAAMRWTRSNSSSFFVGWTWRPAAQSDVLWRAINTDIDYFLCK